MQVEPKTDTMNDSVSLEAAGNAFHPQKFPLGYSLAQVTYYSYSRPRCGYQTMCYSVLDSPQIWRQRRKRAVIQLQGRTVASFSAGLHTASHMYSTTAMKNRCRPKCCFPECPCPKAEISKPTVSQRSTYAIQISWCPKH